MANEVFGGWVWEPIVVESSMPQKIATGFAQATQGLAGASFKPYLYCGHQLVNGTNHMLICLQTLVTNPPVSKMVKVILHESIDGKFNILTIEQI